MLGYQKALGGKNVAKLYQKESSFEKFLSTRKTKMGQENDV